jgi:hypothetical protein
MQFDVNEIDIVNGEKKVDLKRRSLIVNGYRQKNKGDR